MNNNENPNLFYLNNHVAAKKLISKQWADGWNQDDILSYWRCLGYDIFFERAVIYPALKELESE